MRFVSSEGIQSHQLFQFSFSDKNVKYLILLYYGEFNEKTAAH